MTPALLSTASLATAGGAAVRHLQGLAPAWRGASVAGPAWTAAGSSGDNLALHRALASAPRGSVLVAALAGEAEPETAHWGELMCIAAEAAGVAGAVVAGAVRDLGAIERRRYPVFHRGVSPLAPAKLVPGDVGVPVTVAGIVVHPGDLVVGDCDGVVVVAAAEAAGVRAAAAALEEREAELATRLAAGETTVEALGLAQAPSQSRSSRRR